MNVVKGLISTEGSGVGRLSSVPGKVWGGLTHREIGEGWITMGRGEGGRVGGEGHEVGRCTGYNGERWVHWSAGRWRNQGGWGRHREYGQLTWQG